MVASCCVCKLTGGEIPNVSFHRLPADETRRNQWLAAIKRDVTKTSTICSRHFKKSDFNYKVDQNKYYKTLNSSAVPSLLLTADDQRTVESSENVYPLQTINNNASDIHQVQSPCQQSLSVAKIQNQEENESVSLQPRTIVSKVEIDWNVEDSIKRTNTEQLPVSSRKKLRFLGDLKREDFTSQAAYEIVLKHHEECRKKSKAKDKIISRLQERAEYMKELIDHLKDAGIILKVGYALLHVSFLY